MIAARPFRDSAHLLACAERVADTLEPPDWLEAFAAHPEIGATATETATAAWSRDEQAGMSQADATLRRRMTEANAAYRTRFGFLFLICATGRTAESMLAELERRLAHEPPDEIAVAAAEQRKITALRLEKLLHPGET